MLGRGKESESKDKKSLFVTYNLCRFNQSQGEGREIGLAAPKGLNRAEIRPETPAPTLIFKPSCKSSDSCVSFVPSSSPLRLLELGRLWGEPGKLLTNEIVF